MAQQPLHDSHFQIVSEAEYRRYLQSRGRLTRWVRACLVVIAVGFAIVFGIALWLNPYDETGQPRRLATHTQLGMSPCGFYQMTDVPCPSCGMTTSFALLMHGDLVNSLRANAAGTLLALLGLAAIPWSLVSAWRGRYLWIANLDRVVLVLIYLITFIMIVRWLCIGGWRLLGF
jgi:hypothetical protein